MGLTRYRIAKQVNMLLNESSPRDFKTGDSYRAVHAIFHVITKALLRGDEVSISGFGIFRRHTRPPLRRSVCYTLQFLKSYKYLPQVMKEIPAKSVIVFKPSKVLKRMIKNAECPNK